MWSISLPSMSGMENIVRYPSAKIEFGAFLASQDTSGQVLRERRLPL